MYSQAFQDEAARLLLGDKGYFVDIGAGYDIAFGINSNSLMLEELGWNGIAIDGDSARIGKRNCITECAIIGSSEENTVDLTSILDKHAAPQLVDFLSIDIEGGELTALKSFVNGHREFKFLTVEHNLYTQNPGTRELKYDVFCLLTKHGYIRLIDNVGHQAVFKEYQNGSPFEDWYIHPKHINYQHALKTLGLK